MSQQVEVKMQLLPSYEGLPLPAYQTEGAAGFDFYAAESIHLPRGDYAMIATGVKVAIPNGYELQVRPRSGLAAKYGITVLNAPGTVDSDYRGEIKIILINLGKSDFSIERGMRIAQGIIAPYVKGEFSVVASLEETERGDGGFGHTGL